MNTLGSINEFEFGSYQFSIWQLLGTL